MRIHRGGERQGAGLNFGGKSEANPGSRVRAVGSLRESRPKLTQPGRNRAAAGRDRRLLAVKGGSRGAVERSSV
jgi:hypothetical protein